MEYIFKHKNKNLYKPKNPIFKIKLANKILISVVTSTCISGNHTWKGQMGYLIANTINKKNHIIKPKNIESK